MVRLIGLSSSNPILMKGKANAQKIIGKRIRNGKYFFVDPVELSVNRDIVEEDKGNQLLNTTFSSEILVSLYKVGLNHLFP